MRQSMRMVAGVVLACLLAVNVHAAAPKQKTYASAEEAAKDLVSALKSGKQDALGAILGSAGNAIVSSGDKVADARGRALFVQEYEAGNKLEKAGDDRVVLSIGKDAWPFPIPIVKDAGGWRFDAQAGQEEILNRRIGRNELFTMQAALAYVDAQREYYLANPQKAKLHQYAQKVASSPGRRDGLYYPTKVGEAQSPLGPRYDAAVKAGYTKDSGTYHGYRYRILKGQGPDAKGGAYSYTAKGAMIGGHALVAWPAVYGNSGIMTFAVSHDGVLYEKDLGPQTEAEAKKLTRFNPDKTWKAVAK